jgi:carbonic anhydrase/acetyltransferase-like protein (isoleucine patch superfamily)
MAIYALGERTPTLHPDAFVHPDAIVIGDVDLGPEATVWPGAVLRGDYGQIFVGARTSVQDGAVVHATAKLPTLIGADCVIGHLAHLEGCVVEDRCLIGSGSVVLHRALVRSGALVGAGAVVPNDLEIPARAMALGIPAKIRLDAVPKARSTRPSPNMSPTVIAIAQTSAASTEVFARTTRSPNLPEDTPHSLVAPRIDECIETSATLGERVVLAKRGEGGLALVRWPGAAYCDVPDLVGQQSSSIHEHPCREPNRITRAWMGRRRGLDNHPCDVVDGWVVPTAITSVGARQRLTQCGVEPSIRVGCFVRAGDLSFLRAQRADCCASEARSNWARLDQDNLNTK